MNFEIVYYLVTLFKTYFMNKNFREWTVQFLRQLKMNKEL